MREPGPCAFQTADGPCGAVDDVDRYLPGDRCPRHTPAAVKGRPEVVPNPALTVEGLRRAWYADQGRDYQPSAGTPETSTIIDDRRIASGKTRSGINTFRAAQAAVKKGS